MHTHTDTHIVRINYQNRVTVYKASTQKSVASLYTNNEQSEKKNSIYDNIKKD